MLRVKQQMEPHTNFTWVLGLHQYTHLFMEHTLNAHCQPPNSPPHLELILGSLFLTREKFPKKRNRKTRGKKKRFLRLSILNPQM